MVAGKVALVTGGGSGIGRGTCQVLAREGAKVVVADVNMEGAEETLKSLAGGNHMSLFMDVTKKQSIEDGIKAIKDKYKGPPTICVNNAGIINMKLLMDNTDEEYDKLMAVNIYGTVYVTKAVCRELIEAKLPGSIVNLSSMGVKGGKRGALYCMTKGAVKTFGKSIAKEFGSYGIRCNIVLPGTIDTPMGITVDANDKNLIPHLISSSALQRQGKPQEVGELITFLASERSSYMTGACLWIDGGL